MSSLRSAETMYAGRPYGRALEQADAFFTEGSPSYEVPLVEKLGGIYANTHDASRAACLWSFDNLVRELEPSMYTFAVTDEFTDAARKSAQVVFEASDETGAQYSVLQQKTTGLRELIHDAGTRDVVMDFRRMGLSEKAMLEAYGTTSEQAPNWFMRMRPVLAANADVLRAHVLEAEGLNELSRLMPVPEMSSPLSAAAARLALGTQEVISDITVPAADFFHKMERIYKSGTLNMLFEADTQEGNAIRLIDYMSGRLRATVAESIVNAAAALSKRATLEAEKAEIVGRQVIAEMFGHVALYGINEVAAPAVLVDDYTLNVLSLSLRDEARLVLGGSNGSSEAYSATVVGSKFMFTMAPSVTGLTWLRIDALRAEHDEATAAQAFQLIGESISQEAA